MYPAPMKETFWSARLDCQHRKEMNEKAKIGQRFRYGKLKNSVYATVWEITEVQERGVVVELVYAGSRGRHGHKHLVEWKELDDAVFI